MYLKRSKKWEIGIRYPLLTSSWLKKLKTSVSLSIRLISHCLVSNQMISMATMKIMKKLYK